MSLHRNARGLSVCSDESASSDTITVAKIVKPQSIPASSNRTATSESPHSSLTITKEPAVVRSRAYQQRESDMPAQDKQVAKVKSTRTNGLNTQREEAVVSKVVKRRPGSVKDSGVATHPSSSITLTDESQQALQESNKSRGDVIMTQEMIGKHLADAIYDDFPKHGSGKYAGLPNFIDFWDQYEETVFVSPEELAKQKKEVDEFLDRVPTLVELIKKDFTK